MDEVFPEKQEEKEDNQSDLSATQDIVYRGYRSFVSQYGEQQDDSCNQ